MVDVGGAENCSAQPWEGKHRAAIFRMKQGNRTGHRQAGPGQHEMAATQGPDVHGVFRGLAGLQPICPGTGGIDDQGREDLNGRIVFLWLNQQAGYIAVAALYFIGSCVIQAHGSVPPGFGNQAQDQARVVGDCIGKTAGAGEFFARQARHPEHGFGRCQEVSAPVAGNKVVNPKQCLEQAGAGELAFEVRHDEVQGLN